MGKRFVFLRWAAVTGGSVLLLLCLLVLLLKFSIGPYLRLQSAMTGSGKEPGKEGPRKPGKPREAGNSDREKLLAVYPGKDMDEIRAILKDTRESAPTGPKVLHPLPFSSEHVNISAGGFREIRPQRDFRTGPGFRNVFVFGGSTAWGYGLPDGETIASHLQRELETADPSVLWNVFNYGVCASYSKYETRHLARLVDEGRIPDVAIFIDGLNEFCRIPLNRPREDGAGETALPKFLFDWVAGPLAFWRAELFGHGRPKDALVPYDESDLRRAAGEMASRWEAAAELCRERGVRCLFVLQPVPVYGYPLERSPFLDEAGLAGEYAFYLAARRGYEILFDEEILKPIDHLDLHRLRIEGEEYLDTCHYTSAFSRAIAGAVAPGVLNDP